MVRLSIVFLNYNTRDLTRQALNSVLAAAEGLTVEIFVVDNASVDGSADMVAEEFPQVKLICNEANVGFAAGNNVALRQVTGEYVLLINTDTIVRRDALRTMVEFLDAHPEAGACGCKILDPDGTLQLDSRRGFPTPLAAFCKMSGLSRFFPKHPLIAHYHMTYLDPEQTAEVEVLSGSCMMVRKAAMDQVGLLDEDYFMYGEDIDWCYRFHQAGWKIYYVPTTSIIHFRGESGRGVPLRILYRKSRAMSIFVNKHMARRFRFFPLWLLQVGIALYGTFRLLARAGRALAMPLIDAGLVLCGLKLGLAVRYHQELVPFIYRIEQVSNLFGLDVQPTRWLVPPPYSDLQWAAVYGASTLVWLLAFYASGLYDRRRYSVAWSVVGVTLGFACIVMLVFFFKAYNFSRLAVVAAWFCNLLLIAGWRLAARWFLYQRGREGRLRTLLVGTDVVAVHFVEQLERTGMVHCDLIGVVGDGSQQRGCPLAGRPVVGHVGELEALVDDFAIDHLVFTPSAMASFLEQPVQSRRARDLRVSMVPVAFAEMVADRGAHDSAPLPLVEIRTGS
ncbi:MAG: glycosyltransferase [Gemmatimonadetes bacterium]|nr:glycosyltransferase [Gemmatimonadota bacterium]MYI61585.1 glycosyltransferase [Gemmatimonadota bacterium]